MKIALSKLELIATANCELRERSIVPDEVVIVDARMEGGYLLMEADNANNADTLHVLESFTNSFSDRYTLLENTA